MQILPSSSSNRSSWWLTVGIDGPLHYSSSSSTLFTALWSRHCREPLPSLARPIRLPSHPSTSTASALECEHVAVEEVLGDAGLPLFRWGCRVAAPWWLVIVSGRQTIVPSPGLATTI